MAKRSRSERRKGQVARAAADGSALALEQIADRNPEDGVRALLLAIEKNPSLVQQADTVALGTKVCGDLRAKRDFALALRLAQAFRRCCAALCAEEALAAFALGQDVLAREAASGSPETWEMLAHIFSLVEASRIPPTPPRASPELRGMIALARAIAAKRDKKTSVSAALKQVPSAVQSTLNLKEFQWVLDLLGNRTHAAHKAAAHLGTSELTRKSPRVAEAFARTVAARAPAVFESVTSDLLLSSEVRSELEIQMSLSPEEMDTPGARISKIISSVGYASFPPEQRAAAAVYEGFAFKSVNPERAITAFDAALASGADLMECLRGRLLVQYRVMQKVSSSETHKAFASTAMRLHAVLVRDPDGVPAAILCALLSADRRIQAHQVDLVESDGAITPQSNQEATKAARENIVIARALAEKAGLFRGATGARILLNEANLCFWNRDQETGWAKLDAALRMDPRCLLAWELKAALSKFSPLHDPDDVVLEAHQHGLYGLFAERARDVMERRAGKVGIVPGVSSAGHLVKVQLGRMTAAAEADGICSDLAPDVQAGRSALTAEAQLAFDVYVAEAAASRRLPGADTWVQRVLAQGKPAQKALAAVAVAQKNRPLYSLLLPMNSRSPLSEELLGVLLRYLLFVGSRSRAYEIASRAFPYLNRAAAKRIMALVDGFQAQPDSDPTLVVQALLDQLQPDYAPDGIGAAPRPEFSLFCDYDGLFESAAEEDSGVDSDDDPWEDSDDDPWELDSECDDEGVYSTSGPSFGTSLVDEKRQLLVAMGVPMEKIALMSTTSIDHAFAAIGEIVAGPPTPRSAKALIDLLISLGASRRTVVQRAKAMQGQFVG